MKKFTNPAREEWIRISARPEANSKDKRDIVNDIIREVKTTGDDGLRALTARLDGARIDEIPVPTEFTDISPELSEAVINAKRNIETFHESQFEEPKEIVTTDGVTCWRRSVPIENVGIYIPGGTAPLFSTVLMLAVPAKLAGCRQIVLCTPPNQDGRINEYISHTAKLCGIDIAYRIGGAQAIAAMAFGSESVPKCDKIFGPGNSFVTLAKQIVSAEGVAIDMPAGPSEVAVVADSDANPAFIASDLIAQAEHGTDSQVVLVSDSEKLIEKVAIETKNQLESLPRKEIAKKALENSFSVLFEDIRTGMEFVNEYAPEHLIISTSDSKETASSVVNAGSVFVGKYSCESAGDYASGTNHTLPTNGFARSFSGVSLDSFMKKITFQELTEDGLRNLGPTIIKLAEAEELKGHSESVAVRMRELEVSNDI